MSTWIETINTISGKLSIVRYIQNVLGGTKMPVEINDRIYFRTADVCKKANISRTTLFRWLKEGILVDNYLRDRRGWRLYSEEDLEKILKEATKTKLI